MRTHRSRLAFTLVLSCSLAWLAGCAHPKPPEEPKPVMSAGEGAITGKLVNADGDPFDMSLANEGTAAPLQIKLISPDHAVAATVLPWMGKPQFTFDHVKPGTYELSAYRAAPGKRAVAGSEPVTVDAGQVTPTTLTVVVKEEGEEKTTR